MIHSFSHGYALLIGVGQSSYPEWSLPVTAQDVSALQAILTESALCGYPNDNEHLRLLCDADATCQGIIDGLQWLQEKAKADPTATTIVYYSGHGWLDNSSGEYYLVPHDIKPHKFTTTALPAKVFTAAIQQIQAQKLLVILDCCHAEGMANSKGEVSESDLPDGFVKAPAKGQFDRLAEVKGVAILSSSDNDQLSWIRKDQTCSIFTYHLIDALRGGDNKPGDTEVTVMNLINYLGKTVPENTLAEWQKVQKPQWEGKGSNDFPIALLHGGKGLPEQGFKEIEPPPAPKPTPNVMLGERAISIGGSAQGAIVASGDGNVIQSGNGNFNISALRRHKFR
jgi:Caspase domain